MLSGDHGYCITENLSRLHKLEKLQPNSLHKDLRHNARVGVLVNFERKTVTYFIDYEVEASEQWDDMPDALYPAVSLSGHGK